MQQNFRNFRGPFRYRWSDLPFMALLVALYSLVSYEVSQEFNDSNYISLLWPCSGIAISMLLLGGIRYLPVILLGEFWGTFITGYSFDACLLFAFINATEYFMTFWLLTRHTSFDPHLQKPRDFLLLISVGAVMGGISSSISALVLLESHFLDQNTFWVGMLHWWQGDLVGIFLVTPFILTWKDPPRHWLNPGKPLEAIVFVSLTLLAGQVIFLEWFGEAAQSHARAFLMFMFLTWGAVRFGRHGAILVIAITTFQAVTGAVHGLGYFGDEIARYGLQNLWLYLITLTLVGVSLSLQVESQQQTKINLLNAKIHLQKLMQKIEHVREEERKHIAHEIHDELGQILTAARLELASLKRTHDPSSQQVEDLDKISHLIEDSLKVMRNVAVNLRPPALNLGLAAAITWLAQKVEQDMKLPCHLEIQGVSDHPQEPIDTSIFRIVQEALTNVVRHAHATQARIRLIQEGLLLNIAIEDDGIGFDANAQSIPGAYGIGLYSMLDRAESIGGSLTIDSSPGAGTRIHLLLQMPAPEE